MLEYLQSKLICLSSKEREMNKKSARRKRNDIIAKLAMTSALTLGVGAAATMTGQTEAKAEVLYMENLDMRDKAAVEKFANELKELVKKKESDHNLAWRKLSLILNGYKNFTQKIETELQASQQKVQELNELISKEKEQLEALKKELETEKAKEAEDIAKLQKEITEKGETISNLQGQLEAFGQKVKELEAEKAALQEKLAMQEQAHAEEKAKLQKEIEDLKAQLEKLKHCQDT
ncbi:TPA: cell surface-anchored protein, partial [Streptococcus equi subsp. zooepidemicus]|nr:cell surface-anchored protein [Streptococcus equi subsp. zooepidemicus]HEL0484142.1 cell surface-anchored protein [Streptococcus equi subsp. zooepidemicus]HEL0503475.1 cell surface-anchored protein [Streptococcus equi subsp. zooepidemicus]HEL0509432.1 cell surface-anchored protein [Streptococcus equi subsp. zooepidemicus]